MNLWMDPSIDCSGRTDGRRTACDDDDDDDDDDNDNDNDYDYVDKNADDIITSAKNKVLE